MVARSQATWFLIVHFFVDKWQYLYLPHQLLHHAQPPQQCANVQPGRAWCTDVGGGRIHSRSVHSALLWWGLGRRWRMGWRGRRRRRGRCAAQVRGRCGRMCLRIGMGWDGSIAHMEKPQAGTQCHDQFHFYRHRHRIAIFPVQLVKNFIVFANGEEKGFGEAVQS